MYIIPEAQTHALEDKKQRFVKATGGQSYAHPAGCFTHGTAAQRGSLAEDAPAKQAPTMLQANAPSSLLTLPPELRNRIHEYVVSPELGEGGVIGETSICVRTTPFAEPVNPCYIHGPVILQARTSIRGKLASWRAQPPVTRVCRQIRQEALLLFYSMNTFVAYFACKWTMRPGHAGRDKVEEWMERLGGTNAGFVKDLRLVFLGSRTGSSDDEIVRWIGSTGYGIARAAVEVVREGEG
ncbi:hypothetical protein LTR36_006971 [Oleoguttula mirabilis]|uniref:Uncharacterized protein n=1 Tax=Oleoguttula mirabilis TaxID=1507867 RepID=A0AAV9JBZ0_9PEZI|nr:hypothetical protein LTR36_006971 [Oleoguttula mirabilis]